MRKAAKEVAGVNGVSAEAANNSNPIFQLIIFLELPTPDKDAYAIKPEQKRLYWQNFLPYR